MPVVETVRGPVDTGELGPALMHEHIFIASTDAIQNWGSAFGEPYWDEQLRVADAVAKLTAVREAGIRTLVDPTVPGIGRYIPRIQRVNAEVDLNIIVAAGVYAFMELPQFLANRSIEQIAELFVRELTVGINDTGVRAGFLKCAVEHHGVIGDVPRILDAIAVAATETGAPVMVHTNASARTGVLALEQLIERGVDPERIVIAHAGDSNDLGYLRAIADTGASLGLDRFGIEHFNPTADRLRTLLALLEAGYGESIHLGHDAACFYDFMHANPPFADERPDYLLLWREVLPALREAGVGEAQIEQLTTANPRRFFERAA
jgi:phosphotriesterase-related protein